MPSLESKVAPAPITTDGVEDAADSSDTSRQQQDFQPPLLTKKLTWKDYSATELLMFKIRVSNCIIPLIFTLIIILYCLVRLYQVFVDRRAPDSMRWFFTARILFLAPVCFIYMHGLYSCKHIPDSSFRDSKLNWIGSAFLIGQAVITGAALLIFVTEQKKGCESTLCGSNQPSDGILPMGYLLHNIIAAIMMPVVFVCHHFWAVPLSTFISTGFMMWSSVVVGLSANDKFLIALSGVTILLSNVSHERNTFLMYFANVQFKKAVWEKNSKENEAKLMKMQSEEMRHLIGNVAHDLRTPLQAMTSESELILGALKSSKIIEGEKSKELEQSVSQLNKVCAFMHMSINRCVDYTKATSGMTLTPKNERISVREVLEWTTKSVQPSHTHVQIVVQDPSEYAPEYIFTDKQWLLENLICLLTNAIKYTSKGNILVSCSVDHATMELNDCQSSHDQPPGQMMRFEVTDSGNGISDSKKRLLFLPTKQTQRSTGGTGLGLYSLSKRIESLGGRCGVSDRLDACQGSCFWFTIPIRADVTSSSETSRLGICSGSMSRIDRCSNIDNSIRFLVVDDSVLIQKATSRLLKAEGHNVEIACNGAEAVNRCNSPQGKKFDVILMDIEMPVMDGIEATLKIRDFETKSANDARCSNHIIIGVSANSERGASDECFKAGMDGFIDKPLTLEKLKQHISQFGLDL